MKKITFVNGSPSGTKATSLIFLKELEKRLSEQDHKIRYHSLLLNRHKKYESSVLKQITGSDAIVFSFPLYAYSLPAPFIKLLEELESFCRSSGLHTEQIRVYCIVNCGFHDPAVNREAIRVMRIFCNQIGMQFRFATLIGGGLVVAMMRNVPIVNRKLNLLFRRINMDLQSNGSKTCRDILIKPAIPKRIMNFMKDSEWSKRYMKKRDQRKKRLKVSRSKLRGESVNI
jgi:hypothetical protein